MITRFAPSPTGPLHLGHAYSALLAFDLAASAGGTFLLRIEDIDRDRSRPEWEAQIYDDLAWLGLTWPQPVLRQSDRADAYAKALDQLWDMGLLYPCHCTRKDIAAAAEAPQEGGSPLIGPDGIVYPGTCKGLPKPDARPQGTALRLDIKKALQSIDTISFSEILNHDKPAPRTFEIRSPDIIRTVGDIVLSRRDFPGSYHLSVVLDDAAQGVTDVVRGADLFDATAIHVVLQRLLDLPTPRYHHHRLIRDDDGKRLAKRDDARSIATYRDQGVSPRDIRQMVGLQTSGPINSTSSAPITEV